MITLFILADLVLLVILLLYRPKKPEPDDEKIGGTSRNWCAFEETEPEHASYFKYNGTLRKLEYKFASYAPRDSLATHFFEVTSNLILLC